MEYIKTKQRVLILVPSLHLISQTYKKLQKRYPKRNMLCICSQLDKESLTCNELKDENRANRLLKEFIALDYDVKYTTDEKIIKKKLKSKSIIVLCTYQSSNLLKDACFHCAIFDEAYKTVNNKKFGFALYFLIALPTHCVTSMVELLGSTNMTVSTH